jgi:hypothetical protein
MNIKLSPQRTDQVLPPVSKQGDTLVIGEESFDFSQVTEGGLLPADAIDSPWIVGDITRQGGILQLGLVVPHGANAPQETLFPQPISSAPDGLIVLPPYEATEEPQ